MSDINHEPVNHEDIADKALNVLDQFGITEPVVDAVKIANSLGVQVKEVNLPPKYADVAGFFNEKEKTIYVEATDLPTRKSFTVAHELGHIILGHKNYEVLFRIPKKDALYSHAEKEANSFAAHLLMPDYMLDDCMRKYNLAKSDYSELSRIFGVPISAMKNALENMQ